MLEGIPNKFLTNTNEKIQLRNIFSPGMKKNVNKYRLVCEVSASVTVIEISFLCPVVFDL